MFETLQQSSGCMMLHFFNSYLIKFVPRTDFIFKNWADRVVLILNNISLNDLATMPNILAIAICFTYDKRACSVSEILNGYQ